MHHESKPIHDFRHQLNVNGKRKGDPARLQDCSGKRRLWEVMELSELWVYSIRKMHLVFWREIWDVHIVIVSEGMIVK